MKTVYAVSKSAHVKEPAVICESMADAVVLAEQFNYIGDGGSPEDYVTEVPLIEREPEYEAGALAQAIESMMKLY